MGYFLEQYCCNTSSAPAVNDINLVNGRLQTSSKVWPLFLQSSKVLGFHGLAFTSSLLFSHDHGFDLYDVVSHQ